MSLSRRDNSLLARWWFTVDQSLLTAILILMAIGLVVSLAASPAMAQKRQLAPFFFVERHVLHTAVGLITMLAISLLSPRGVRRLALVTFLIAFAGMIAAVLVGPELNGAHRWISLGGLTIQPSEFAKPAFVVLLAWALAESQVRHDMPAIPIAIALSALFLGALILQPDFGQTMLVAATLGALLLLAGLPLVWPAAVGVFALVLLVIGYFAFDYVRLRVDLFLSGDFTSNDQTARALRAFVEGGIWGRGPGEGTIKTDLPDAHTDFIFAVIAEEYGIIACLAILLLYGIVAYRLIARALIDTDLSARFAAIGLAVIFTLQAMIHMAVNVALLPATGMTLPLISAGGSSTIAICATLGFGLALSRRRPRTSRLKHPQFAATPERASHEGGVH